MRRATLNRLACTLCLVLPALLAFQTLGQEASEGQLSTPPDRATTAEADLVLPSGEALDVVIPWLTQDPLPMSCHEQCAAEFRVCKQACGGDFGCVAQCGVIYDDCFELACG